MKIIIVNSEQLFRLVPDSALLLKHRPFFLPDYVQTLHAKTALVVKINRLGKYIQEKFAHTYYEEIGFAINFYDKNCLDLLVEKSLPWERATCLDGSFAMSEFMASTEFILSGVEGFSHQSAVVERSRNDTPVEKQIFSFDLAQIPKIISELSAYMTLKIGDYIAIELGEVDSAPFAINDVLRLSLNEKDVVRVVVK
ncbi:MAG: fumarylacetoacetate hydrolase family protein [Bacteroidales bacterium]|nr:fumarylacetoacetate hydrolase family protein [Bacteroidales bacterium]